MSHTRDDTMYDSMRRWPSAKEDCDRVVGMV